MVRGQLDFNAVLLLEGEEESTSEGFREAVLQNIHWFRGTSLILHANSTWIGEDRLVRLVVVSCTQIHG